MLVGSPVYMSHTAHPQVRKRNSAAHARLRALCASPLRRVFVFANENHKETYVPHSDGESPNDRNDRAIRTAAAWYKRVCPGVRVVLLTADAANRAKAREEGIEVSRNALASHAGTR
jgi:exosome complex exonuclease DIS3/RRP44